MLPRGCHPDDVTPWRHVAKYSNRSTTSGVWLWRWNTANIWLIEAQAPSETCFQALCIHFLTYLSFVSESFVCYWQGPVGTLVQHGDGHYQLVQPSLPAPVLSSSYQPLPAYQPVLTSQSLTSSQAASPLPAQQQLSAAVFDPASAAATQSASLPQFDPVNNTASLPRPQFQRDIISQSAAAGLGQFMSGKCQVQLAVHDVRQIESWCVFESACVYLCVWVNICVMFRDHGMWCSLSFPAH